MTMREKIARAIYAKRNGIGSSPWANRPNTHKEPYFMDADAVLDALMEGPTEEMRIAALANNHLPMKAGAGNMDFGPNVSSRIAKAIRSLPIEQEGR